MCHSVQLEHMPTFFGLTKPFIQEYRVGVLKIVEKNEKPGLIADFSGRAGVGDDTGKIDSSTSPV